MKYIVCFSGGHSSALVAIETVRKVGKENVILLNHDISPKVEHQDIKRFKREVAEYLDLPITYKNMEGWQFKTPLQIVVECGGVSVGINHCTKHLKTLPFNIYLKEEFPVVKKGSIRNDVTIIYGFDKNEVYRINRRIGVMSLMGYKTDYPLATWDRTTLNTEDVGIRRPITYELFKHANCIGCLKAGKQHWYVVYCMYPDIWEEALWAEETTGFSIIKDNYLSDLEPKFRSMKCKGIVPTEKVGFQRFWADVRKVLPDDFENKPCECAI